MEMRKVFAAELERIMAENKKVCFLDADLAKAGGTMKLRELFPDRAFDVGIAEANMASVAGGMSAYGMIPFISTFAPFASRRISDQIAVSVSYARQNVKVVGLDPGISAELNGGTHMSFEDVGIYRSMPGILIFEPVDTNQLRQAMQQIVDYPGPVYMRLFRKETPDVFTDASYKFDLLKASKIRDGKDVSIFVSGLSTADCVEAADILAKSNISANLINIHTIKPIDKKAIVQSAQKTGAVLTVENHNIYGGLYSAVAEVLSQECPTKCACIGINDRHGQVGKLKELKQAYGLTVEDIVAKAEQLVKAKK